MDSGKTGAFIAELRKENDLTQTALAEKLNISNRTVSKWENGDGYPDITILPQIAEILGVTVDELLLGEKKQVEEKAPETLFDIEFKDSAKIQHEGQITYASRKIPYSTAMIWSANLLVACYAVNNAILAKPLPFFNYITVALAAVEILNIVSMRLYGYLHIKSHIRKNGGESYISRIVISDKISCRDGITLEEYPLESISGFFIGKRVYVIKLYKRLILTIPKSAFGERQEEFEAFIRSKAPSTAVIKAHIAFKLLNALLIVSGVTMLFLCGLRSYLMNDTYFYRDINTKAAYYYDYQDEFNNAVKKIKADKKIAEDIKSDGYSWSEDNIVPLEHIGNSRITDKSVSFDCYCENDCYYGGYLYYEGEGKPWITSLVTFDGDEVDKKETYIKEDDLYLYGKHKNGSVSDKDWFLLKELDENWYYVEYHSAH